MSIPETPTSAAKARASARNSGLMISRQIRDVSLLPCPARLATAIHHILVDPTAGTATCMDCTAQTKLPLHPPLPCDAKANHVIEVSDIDLHGHCVHCGESWADLDQAMRAEIMKNPPGKRIST